MKKQENMFDLIIIGAGPAGVTAGVYAARKKIKTLVITKDFGGQSIVSDSIENWTGEISISGPELSKKLENQLKHYSSDEFVIKEFTLVEKIKEDGNNGFMIKTNQGEEFRSKTVLVTSGAARRKLTVPGADKFEHKGLTYCASCDGPLFTDKDVVVIGGGNAGFESAAQLLAYCKSVTLLQRGDKFAAEQSNIDAISGNQKFKALLQAEISEVFGKDFVEGIKYTDKDKKEITMDVSGVFVEIGAVPASNFIEEGLVEKDKIGQIIINHKTGQTSQPGLYAAGDVTDSIYKQNSIAMGDATKALEDIYFYLQKN